MTIAANFVEPKLIAPVVVYLCHESSTDNGSIIETAAGWAAKVCIIRSANSIDEIDSKQ